MFNTHLKKISRISNYNIDRSLYFRLDANERTIPFSKKERSELFFTGVVEGLILVNYGCVLIVEIYF